MATTAAEHGTMPPSRQSYQAVSHRLTDVLHRLLAMQASGRSGMGKRALRACRAADSVSGTRLGTVRWNVQVCDAFGVRG